MNLVFEGTVRGVKYHFDPFTVRRGLLTESHGRIWDHIHAANGFKTELETLRSTSDADPEITKSKIAIAEVSLANAEMLISRAAYAAFNLASVNMQAGDGVTELEILELLRQFLEYAEGKE